MEGTHWKLVQLRKEKGLTQEDVAKLLEINVSTYIRKEKGEREFKFSELMKLRKILSRSLDEIFFK